MSKDSIGISMGGSETAFNRLKQAHDWIITRRNEVAKKNVTEGKQGVVLQQEKAYQQGYLDAMEHVNVLLTNLQAH